MKDLKDYLVNEGITKVKRELIDKILKIIVCSEKFNVSDYGAWGKNIKKEVSDWIDKNNVSNVEFYLDKDTVSQTYGDPKEIESYTDLKINWLNDYSKIMKKAKSVLNLNNDIITRSGDCNNDEWFFTGSDATHYVLIHSI